MQKVAKSLKNVNPQTLTRRDVEFSVSEVLVVGHSGFFQLSAALRGAALYRLGFYACGILAQTGQGVRAVPPGWSRVTWGFLQKRRLLSCSAQPAADNGMSSQDLPFESNHRTGLGTGWEPHNWVPMVFYLCNSFCCFSTPCGSQVQLINGNELHALRNVANK